MKIHDFLLSASLLGLAERAAAKTLSCKASNFKGIEVPGLEIVDVAASEQHEFTQWMSLFTVMGVPTGTPVDFCNVTVTVTHPGQGDSVHVYVWLPLGEDKWNGRLLGEGGGGWHAGIDTSLAQGVANGFVSANTDAGHSHSDGFPGILSSGTWSLRSPGNVDWNLLQNFASRSVGDLPKVAKEVIKSYYGKPVKHAYWQGCSTGGRQGLMSAQRFAGDYDGILSIAPATNWASFLVTEQWPQLVMRQHNYLPSQCEFNAIHQAAIDECDELDGVKDRIIAATGLCKFDATSAVGRSYECDGVSGKVSKTAAKIANKIWEGPKRNGQNEWFGSTHDMPFGGPGPIDGLANTVCDDKGKNCQALPFPISEDWVKMFLAKDPEYDVKTMTEDEFWSFLAQSRREYSSIMGTDYPDLSEFKAAGGKLIQWHGLADQLIFPNGSSNYFERVLELDPAARDFYRYFDVPGVLHCAGGPGAFPTGALDALIEWVEKGVAPEKIDGQVPPNAEALAGHERIFCPYPLVAAYKGGDTSKKESYECADSFDKFKSSWVEHTEL